MFVRKFICFPGGGVEPGEETHQNRRRTGRVDAPGVGCIRGGTDSEPQLIIQRVCRTSSWTNCRPISKRCFCLCVHAWMHAREVYYAARLCKFVRIFKSNIFQYRFTLYGCLWQYVCVSIYLYVCPTMCLCVCLCWSRALSPSLSLSLSLFLSISRSRSRALASATIRPSLCACLCWYVCVFLSVLLPILVCVYLCTRRVIAHIFTHTHTHPNLHTHTCNLYIILCRAWCSWYGGPGNDRIWNSQSIWIPNQLWEKLDAVRVIRIGYRLWYSQSR